MEKKIVVRPILFLLMLSFIVWIVGCASTGTSVQGERSSSEMADIDELLGLTDESTPEGESENIAEDDVLRLLGVVGEDETTTPTTEDRQATLQDQVETLEQQNAALGEQEQNLLQELAAQEDDLSVLDSGTTGDAVPDREPETPTWKSSSFQDRYQEARRDYTSRQYRDAIQKFQNLLNTNTKHTLSDNCQYWIGESFYGLGNYRQAIVAFEKVFSFPDSNKDADAQLKLGICYMRLNEAANARQEFQKLIDNYPSSEYVSVARRYIEQME